MDKHIGGPETFLAICVLVRRSHPKSRWLFTRKPWHHVQSAAEKALALTLTKIRPPVPFANNHVPLTHDAIFMAHGDAWCHVATSGGMQWGSVGIVLFMLKGIVDPSTTFQHYLATSVRVLIEIQK